MKQTGSEEVAEEQEYILGTDDVELRRLGFQHQVWAGPTARAWEHAGFAPRQRLLDLGCGPGFATLALAELVGPAGEVLAFDASSRFLRFLETQAAARGVTNVRTMLGDAAGMELPPASLDGAFARWVLCFTPDPAAVVERVASALRPGGRFVVLDYCNYEALSLAPPHPAFERVVRATGESVRLRGGSFDVGRHLPRYMLDAGLEVERLEPIVRLARPGTALWKWPETFFSTYLDTLLEMGLIAPEDAEAFREVWRDRAARPEAFLLTPLMVEVVGVKR